jgi:chromosome segregation ATPase
MGTLDFDGPRFVRGSMLCWGGLMTGSSEEDSAARSAIRTELDHLRSRIDLQSEQLDRHARELRQLRQDLDSLDERIDAHQHGDILPSPTVPNMGLRAS